LGGGKIVVIHHAVLEVHALRHVLDRKPHFLKRDLPVLILTKDIERCLLHRAEQAPGLVFGFTDSGVVAVPDSRGRKNFVRSLQNSKIFIGHSLVTPLQFIRTDGKLRRPLLPGVCANADTHSDTEEHENCSPHLFPLETHARFTTCGVRGIDGACDVRVRPEEPIVAEQQSQFRPKRSRHGRRSPQSPWMVKAAQ
jgi:hypothetical protein